MTGQSALREMTSYAALADRLEAALGVVEAVGVVFTADGRAGSAGVVDASCVHWSAAMRDGYGARRTVAGDHAGCSVGSYVHGMSTLEQAAAGEDTRMLVSLGWVDRDALAEVPRLHEPPAGIDYVPLRELETDPELVLLTVTPEQLMAVKTAIPALRLTGKPQCQIVPLAASGIACASVGCAVSRARTDADPAQLTCALPTDILFEAIDALETAAGTDQAAADAVRGRSAA